MIGNVLFFLLTGATLCLLLWTGTEIFRNQEDPLGDRLEGLQSQAMVVAASARRRKHAGRGLDRFLYLVGLFPGGDDWLSYETQARDIAIRCMRVGWFSSKA